MSESFPSIDISLVASSCLAAAFTVLIAVVTVQREAQTALRHFWSLSFGLYLFIMTIGNVAATLVASTLDHDLPWKEFWNAFFGVFAFEQIISKINITIGEEGVLKIQKMIEDARFNAVAEANRREAIEQAGARE